IADAVGRIVIHPARQQTLVVILAVHRAGENILLEIAEAHRLSRGGAGLSEYREQNCGEDRDNCDNDEQLDKGKTPRQSTRILHLHGKPLLSVANPTTHLASN